MNIGAGWLRAKKDANGKDVFVDGKPVMQVSMKIDLPFLGSINATLVRIRDKKGDKYPDYDIIWFPQRDGKNASHSAESDIPSNDEIPF